VGHGSAGVRREKNVLSDLATDFPRWPPSLRTSPNSSGWGPAHGGPGLSRSVRSEWRGNQRSNATSEKGAVCVWT